MPLLGVNAERGCAVACDGTDLAATLPQAAQNLPPGAPVVILIHGYRFAPGHGRHCPHRHILAARPDPRRATAISWPRHLGFGRGDPAEGLCIGFGWQARGTIWTAYGEAARAGAALAALVGDLRRLMPDRPVDLVAHSLGARVALGALAACGAGDIGRMILLAGAELQPAARAAMDSPAGRRAEAFNITSRENDLFDFSLEWLISAGRHLTLGQGPGGALPNWADLQIDDATTLAGLARLGYRIAAPATRICHWSPYLRPGLFPLYRDLLRDREALTLWRLASALPPAQAPRWSRLIAPRGWQPGLPLAGNASS